MNMNVESFMAVLKSLHEHEVEYILVGGLAVIFHGVSRVTKDLDFFVKRNPQNIEKLKRALQTVFDDESITEITDDELVEYPLIRYGTPQNYYIDIIDRIGEAFHYDDLEYEIIESQGIPVRVATLETLIKMKNSTIRMKDRADAFLLMEELERLRKNK
jgi:predicted nucleotidyltransferase